MLGGTKKGGLRTVGQRVGLPWTSMARRLLTTQSLDALVGHPRIFTTDLMPRFPNGFVSLRNKMNVSPIMTKLISPQLKDTVCKHYFHVILIFINKSQGHILDT